MPERPVDATVVIIPTYNERPALASIIGRVRRAVPMVEVLIVDDASPDGTGELADEFAAADPAVHVLHRAAKQGLGAAYKHAYSWALDREFTRLVQLDADGSHQPEQLPALLAAASGVMGTIPADVVVGSRWVEGGAVLNWPKHRQLLSLWGSLYSRWMLALPYRDITAGYRVFSAHALRAIDLDEVHSHGYGFQVDMLWHAHRAGLRIVEVPITFVERSEGKSKMTGSIVLEAMLRVTAWGIADLPARVRRCFGRRGARRGARSQG